MTGGWLGSGLYIFIRRVLLFLVALATACFFLAGCGDTAMRSTAFHLRGFPKGVYLVARSRASDQPLRLSRRFFTSASDAHGIRLCLGTAPSSSTTVEIRATRPDSHLGEKTPHVRGSYRKAPTRIELVYWVLQTHA